MTATQRQALLLELGLHIGQRDRLARMLRATSNLRERSELIGDHAEACRTVNSLLTVLAA